MLLNKLVKKIINGKDIHFTFIDRLGYLTRGASSVGFTAHKTKKHYNEKISYRTKRNHMLLFNLYNYPLDSSFAQIARDIHPDPPRRDKYPSQKEPAMNIVDHRWSVGDETKFHRYGRSQTGVWERWCKNTCILYF